MTFDVTEKRTLDYVRHGTTNLFAALNVGTGEVTGECKPTRNGADFLAFLKTAVAPHTGHDVHVVLDNLSTHSTPVGSSWINQIETWFGIITRQSIRRGTFTSVKALLNRIRDYINHWNSNAEPFVWTATAEDILAK